MIWNKQGIKKVNNKNIYFRLHKNIIKCAFLKHMHVCMHGSSKHI